MRTVLPRRQWAGKHQMTGPRETNARWYLRVPSRQFEVHLPTPVLHPSALFAPASIPDEVHHKEATHKACG